MTLVINIGKRNPADDTGAAYSLIADKREEDEYDRKYEEMKAEFGDDPGDGSGKPAEGGTEAQPASPQSPAPASPDASTVNPAVSAGETPAAPPAPVSDAPAGEDGEWTVKDVASKMLAVGKDVVGGVVSAPRQAVGGVLDALGEVDQFMQQILPIGGASLFDAEGNFDPRLVGHGDMVKANKLEQDIFSMIAPPEADTVTGGFVRSTAQFLTGFIPAAAAVGAAAPAAGAVAGSMVAGALADMVIFDPHEDRLSTYLNTVPGLAAIVPDYLADNNPDSEGEWEGRIKNAAEGLGLGAATEGLVRVFRYYKAQRAAAALQKTNETGAQALAARDAVRDAARVQIVDDVPDEALAPLGDPSGPLLVEAAPDLPPYDEALPKNEFSDLSTSDLAADFGAPDLAGNSLKFKDEFIIDVLSEFEIRRLQSLSEADRKIRLADAVSRAVNDGYVLQALPEEVRGIRIIDGRRAGIADAAVTRAFEEMLALQWNASMGRTVPTVEFQKMLRDAYESHRATMLDAGPLERMGASLSRLKAATARAELSVTNNDALAKITTAVENYGGAGADVSEDTMFELLDQLRSGKEIKTSLPKRPIAGVISQMGGIDPRSSLAGDLRSRGITPKSFPGLFSKAGKVRVTPQGREVTPSLKSLDNIPADEHPIFMDNDIYADANGYIPEQAWIDALEAEMNGAPLRDSYDRQQYDDLIGPMDDLDEQLQRLGIDYENRSNASVKARLQEIADEEARLADMAATPRNMTGEGGADAPAAPLPVNETSQKIKIPEEFIREEIRRSHAKKTSDGIEGLRARLVTIGDAIPKSVMTRLEAVLDGKSSWDDFSASSEMVAGNADMRADVEGLLTDIATTYNTTATRRDAFTEGLEFKRLSEEYTNFLQDFRSRPLETLEDWAAAAKSGDPAWAREPVEARALQDALNAKRISSTANISTQAKGKIYLNYARINARDDVKAVLQAMLDLDADAVNDKRRGVVTHEQTIKESAKEYEALHELIGREPGPMSAAQITAARRLLVASGEQMADLIERAAAPNALPSDLYNFNRAVAVHYAIQSEVVGAATEIARALNALKIPVSSTKARSEAIAQFIENGGGAGNLQNLAKAFKATLDNPTALNVMVNQVGKGKLSDALFQVWINGILSGPLTHMVNMLGNASVQVWSIPERYLAGHISKAFYDGEIDPAETADLAFGMMGATRDAMRLIYLGRKAEFDPGVKDLYDLFVVGDKRRNQFTASAFGLDDAGTIGRGFDLAGQAFNLPGSLLRGADHFFKAIGYRSELRTLASRTARSEGLDGKEFAERVTGILLDPPENLKAEAIDVAQYNTFSTKLGSIAGPALAGLGKVPGFRVVAPFMRIMTNIMKYTFARTPLAYASGAIRSDIRAGGTRAAQAQARIGLGTILMMTVADMTMEGTITGSGPSEPGEAKFWREAGNKEYSIKVGDKHVQYSRLDPIGMMIGIAADTAMALSNLDGNSEGGEKLVGAGVMAIAQNLASKRYMSGLFDFIGAIDRDNPTKDLGKYMTNFSGSLMPFSSFMRWVSNSQDQTLRDTKAVVYETDADGYQTEKIDEIGTYLQTLVNQQKKLIPGLSDELPPLLTLWGKERTRASSMGWAYDLMSPIQVGDDVTDPVDRMIIDNRIPVSPPQRIIQGIRLTPEEYNDFVRRAGEPAKARLDDYYKSGALDQLTDGPYGSKADIVHEVINDFRKEAAEKMVIYNPDLQSRIFLKDVAANKAKQFTGQ